MSHERQGHDGKLWSAAMPEEQDVSEAARDARCQGGPNGVTRKDTFAVAATAALAFAATVTGATAADVARSSKKIKKLRTKKCKKQVGQCTSFLQEACLGNPVCEQSIPCCQLLSNCNATDALLCIFTV